MTIPEGLVPVAYDAGQIVDSVKIERIREKNGLAVWVISGELEPNKIVSPRDRFLTLEKAYEALIIYRNSLL